MIRYRLKESVTESHKVYGRYVLSKRWLESRNRIPALEQFPDYIEWEDDDAVVEDILKDMEEMEPKKRRRKNAE